MNTAFEIGMVINKQTYMAAAIWCNQNGAHIEEQNGQYVIVKNAPAPEASPEEKVVGLERAYGLPRAVRTTLLALQEGGAVLDGQLMARVDEIETLAAPLRAPEGQSV